MQRSKEGRKVLGLVQQYKKEEGKGKGYDISKAKARISVRKDFTSGKKSDNIVSLRTAVHHLGDLKESGDALKRYGADSPVINRFVNYVRDQVWASSEVVDYETAAAAVGAEVASLLKKSAATDPEIAKWGSIFDPKRSCSWIRSSTGRFELCMDERERYRELGRLGWAPTTSSTSTEKKR